MSSQVHVHSHVKSMFDPDGAVLLDLHEGKYFSLNAVGMEIWQQIEQGASQTAIMDHLTSTFDAPITQLKEDMDEFIGTLVERRLVHVEG